MRELGPYRIEGELGRGGMGVVYKGQGPTGQVAIKVLTDGSRDPELCSRFKREAKVLRALDHPHLLRIEAFGVTARQPYLVTEFLAGDTLAQRVRKHGVLPAGEAAACVRALAAGVAHAHSRGLIHRDIKPCNVILNTRGPVLIDFGLGRSLNPDATALTLSGSIMGTPGFMPPEQARAEAVGPAADVYALGATLYYALTGRAPFQGSAPLAVLHQVVSVDPPAPSELVRGVPATLEAIVLRCLEKQPDARFPSAFALESALAEFLAPAPLQAPRGRRAIAWAAASALLCVGAALAASPEVHRPALVEAGAAVEAPLLAADCSGPQSSRSPADEGPGGGEGGALSASAPRVERVKTLLAGARGLLRSRRKLAPSPAPRVAVPLLGEGEDLEARGWTFDGSWHALSRPGPGGETLPRTLLTLGSMNRSASARVRLAPSVEPTQLARGWRFELGFELPQEATLDLQIQEDGELPALTVSVTEGQLEAALRRPGSALLVTYKVALLGAPSAIALEWRGQELSLDVERADGSRACRTLELQAPPPSPDPRHTSLELGFSELPEGATVTARLTDPTLVVLTD